MNEIKIEKGIPIPTPIAGAGFSVALKQLEVGDSFLWSLRSQANLHASAKLVGIKIATRKQPGGQYRIWRKA